MCDRASRSNLSFCTFFFVDEMVCRMSVRIPFRKQSLRAASRASTVYTTLCFGLCRGGLFFHVAMYSDAFTSIFPTFQFEFKGVLVECMWAREAW